eukprot:scaffold1087_cov136-Cylindrotheca_fusiformis.AAC.16
MRTSKRDMSHVRVTSSEIRKRAFENVRELAEVQVQDGLVIIGDYAFYNCFLLKDINIPTSLKVIGKSAFAWCARLPPLELPQDLESIGERAFSNCSFASFRVPMLISELRNGVFSACFDMVSLEIPEGVTLLEEKALFDCRRLRNVALPSPDTVTERDVFQGCRDLEKIYPNDDELLHVLKNRFEGLPIHKLCYYQTYYPTATTLEKLQQLSGQNTTRRQDCLGMTPLHILALSTNPSLELFQAVLKGNHQDLVTMDKWGDLPLYYACFIDAPLEIVKLFLEVHKTEFLDRPLNWTKMVEESRLEVTEYLLETHKNWFPKQEVNWSKLVHSFLRGSLEHLKCIVKYSVSNRLNHLGNDEWKDSLLGDIERMPGNQGLLYYFWNVRKRHIDRIHCKLEEYELVEATTLLELAIWKAKMEESSCCKEDDLETSMEISREQSRITCGADIILMNIVPFLRKETKEKAAQP